jgi:hypothetical protein
MTPNGIELRRLVGEIVREIAEEARGNTMPRATAGSMPVSTTTATSVSTTTQTPHSVTSGRNRVEPVVIASDADLDRFARHLLSLFENPKNRQDLRSGRLRFRLTGRSGAPASTEHLASQRQQSHRIDSGAVTERHIVAVAEAGGRLILGRRAVLTPLGRERARALGVTIEKER